ncbi:hypothetical protein M758_1G218700 [Ceratodon purpureus]|nr:hypothetical protein M758_1G218700 [Ceratodon purpureus]
MRFPAPAALPNSHSHGPTPQLHAREPTSPDHITSHRIALALPRTALHCTATQCSVCASCRNDLPPRDAMFGDPGKLWMPGTVRDLVTLVDETEMRLEMSGTRRLEVRPRLVMRGTVS